MNTANQIKVKSKQKKVGYGKLFSSFKFGLIGNLMLVGFVVVLVIFSLIGTINIGFQLATIGVFLAGYVLICISAIKFARAIFFCKTLKIANFCYLGAVAILGVLEVINFLTLANVQNIYFSANKLAVIGFGLLSSVIILMHLTIRPNNPVYKIIVVALSIIILMFGLISPHIIISIIFNALANFVLYGTIMLQIKSKKLDVELIEK